MGCLGNGITVCNKAVKENGDYKDIPGSALLRIEHNADAMRENWEKWLDSMPELQQYEKLLDCVPVNVMLYAMNLGGGIRRKIEYLKKVCYEKSYF